MKKLSKESTVFLTLSVYANSRRLMRMTKTITLRVSEEELEKIQLLRQYHFEQHNEPITQSQLIRDFIHEKYEEIILKQDEEAVKTKLYLEKEQAHKRDIFIVDQLRTLAWAKG